ncbi:MAG: hypothetical protein ACOCZK_08185 [Planctomycetota bacterium]
MVSGVHLGLRDEMRMDVALIENVIIHGNSPDSGVSIGFDDRA